MQDFIKEALLQQGLMDAYRNRPAYQQNDYIGWITRAKRPGYPSDIIILLEELESGDRYMKMEYNPRRPPR